MTTPIVPEKPPKVFISYAWTNDPHIEWVIRFMTKLRDNGVNVVMDRTHLEGGHDVNAFMESMVVDPEFKRVLCICDANYTNKANKRSGGVGTEAQIITPDLYGKTDQKKFIPIIREKDQDGKPLLPVFFKSILGFDFSDDALYEVRFKELIHHIFDRPIYDLPPLGTPPAYLYATDRFSHLTGSAFQEFKATIKPLAKTPIQATRNYLNSLFTAFKNFPISEDREVNALDRLMEAIAATKSYRDEFVQFVMSWIFLEDVDPFVREVHRFFEKCAPITYYSEREHQEFFVREIFTYFVAIMLLEGRSKELGWFLSEPYIFERRGEPFNRTFPIFEPYLKRLEEWTNRRLQEQKQNLRISVAADILHDRIDEQIVTLDELLQAEFVLAVRSAVLSGSRPWFPRLLTYAEGRRYGTPFPVFAKAMQPRFMAELLQIMGFDSADKFKEAIGKAFQEGVFQRLQMREWWDCDYQGMMGLKYLFPEDYNKSP